MKKLIAATALACFALNAQAHGTSFGRIVGGVVVGSIVAGALMPRHLHAERYYAPGTNGYPQYSPYSGTTVYCPSCAPQYQPPIVIDNAGVQYNQFGQPVCMALPLYDGVGNVVGFRPGC